MWILTLFITCSYISFIITTGISTPVAPAAVLILARGGSKGIRLKNLQQVGGKSLIRNTVEIAKSAGFADITVSTDHPLIALEAFKCNVTIFRRSAVTATDWAPSIWGAMEFLSQKPEVDILILMQATSPFIKSSHLRGAVNKLRSLPYDCIFSAARSHKLRWQIRGRKLYPVNFDAIKRPRRQDWSGEFLETGSFYISRKSLVAEGRFQSNNCTLWETSSIESFEIDTYNDLQVANALLAANLV